MDLQGYDLRYLITSLVGRGVTTTHRLRDSLESLGVDLGPDPRRRLHGALRSEMRKGRLRRVDRGVYALGTIPPSTLSHLRRRAAVIEASIRAGARQPPPRHRYGSASVARPEGAWPPLAAGDHQRV